MSTSNSDNDNPNPMHKIKHIVLSGGGGTGFAYYGALRESHKDGFWNINDIQTMHGISCGTIIIFILVMVKYISWEDFDIFLTNRPWETVFGFSPDKLLKAYSNVGICDKETIKNVFSPILGAVDLSLNITMSEFYNFSGIEFHCYTTNLDTYKLVDISYKTHPDWELLDAIYSSCALPLLFRPNRIDDKIYIDGGFLCNYPLQQCIDQIENPDEIFGINKTTIVEKSNSSEDINISNKPEKSTEYENIIDYLLDIIAKIGKKLILEKTKSKYTMEIKDITTSAWEVYETIKTKETRSAKIQYGVESWKDYRNKIGFTPLYENSDSSSSSQ